MIKYQTFGRRVGAGMVDGLIFFPFSFVEFAPEKNLLFFISWELLYVLAWSIYTIGLHVRFGQTVGKMVFNVKLFDLSEKTTLPTKRAFIRESVWITAQLLALLFFLLYSTNNKYLDQTSELYSSIAGSVSLAWILIEVITMLLNAKRRSIQDIMARSVVLKID